MNNKAKKIALVGTYYTESVGDSLLFECVKYLYKKNALKYGIELKFKVVDMYGRANIKRINRSFSARVVRKLMRMSGYNFKYIKLNTATPNYSYYLNMFEDCDMVVIAGGGLFKYSVARDYTDVFRDINNAAKALSIPVVYNAVGVEGEHDINSEKFQKMKESFNDSVKLFSCRERFDVIRDYFGGDSTIPIFLVADTGVWIKETFAKFINNKDKKIIGINPVGQHFYNMHGKMVQRAELLQFWSNLITLLDSSEYTIQIFTNGNSNDYWFAKELYDNVKRKVRSKMVLREAKTPTDMVKNISRCGVIIANRLHTCISAYSMGIPALGVAWNDKLLNWGKTIKLDEYFFDFNEMDVEKVYIAVNKIKDIHYDEEHKEELKLSIDRFADEAVKLLF